MALIFIYFEIFYFSTGQFFSGLIFFIKTQLLLPPEASLHIYEAAKILIYLRVFPILLPRIIHEHKLQSGSAVARLQIQQREIPAVKAPSALKFFCPGSPEQPRGQYTVSARGRFLLNFAGLPCWHNLLVFVVFACVPLHSPAQIVKCW